MSRPDAREEARRWLAQAENDAFAEHGARLGFHAQTCFLCRQVAEKAVKAVHYLRGARTVFGHAVDALLEPLETTGLPVGPLRPAARRLDRHYVPTRYPNGLPGNVPADVYSEQDSTEALVAAHSIVAFAREQLELAS